MHEAFVQDMKNSFSSALQKDRLYLKASGFLQQNGIWIMAALMKYMVKKVLHFTHEDFMKAIKIDLAPLMSNMGVWMLQHYADKVKQQGKMDKLKKVRVALEIVKNIMEKDMAYISQEKKYNFINKFGPKKCPDQVIARD
jgi:hypothetical protein